LSLLSFCKNEEECLLFAYRKVLRKKTLKRNIFFQSRSQAYKIQFWALAVCIENGTLKGNVMITHFDE
jgi:hypothetical protein